jgi:transposase
MSEASGSAPAAVNAVKDGLYRRRWHRTSSTKGIPTTGLLAQVLVAKYLDHLPL